MRRIGPAVMLAIVLVMVLSFVVFASDGLPWDDLEIAVSGVVFVWGAVVAALIQIGKAVHIGGRPLLGNDKTIWAANLLLGGVGVLIYELVGGAPWGAALLAAGAAVVTASGVFEGIKTASGKGSSRAGTTLAG